MSSLAGGFPLGNFTKENTEQVFLVDPRSRPGTYIWMWNDSITIQYPVANIGKRNPSLKQLMAAGIEAGTIAQVLVVWSYQLVARPKIGDQVVDELGQTWMVKMTEGKLFNNKWDLTCTMEVGDNG